MMQVSIPTEKGDNMYIHPFWCGVAATIIAETVALIVATVWVSVRSKKQKDIKCCGQCDATDGVTYTSDPPMVRCKVDGKFHSTEDVCDCR